MQWNEKISKKRHYLIASLSWVLLLGQGQPLRAEESQAIDPDFFSDVHLDNVAGKAKGKSKFTGYFQQQLAYSPEDQDYFAFSRQDSGLSQARSTLSLKYNDAVSDHFDYEISANAFYDIYYHTARRNQFSESEFKAMGDEIELRNAYVNFETVDGLWFKLGKQIVAWGESEFVQIIDMVNPRDQKEFGIVDLEDSRIPVWASRMSYVAKQWGSDVVLVHHFEPNKNAGASSDFDPYIFLRPFVDINDHRNTDVRFSNPDIFYRLFVQGGHADVSFVYAKSHQTASSLDFDASHAFSLETTYPDIETLGLSANYVYGFWLFKTEMANKTGVLFPKKVVGDAFNVERSYHQFMFGLEYSGINDVQIASEYITNHASGDAADLRLNANDDSFSNRVNFQFLNQTVNVEFLLAHWIQGHSNSGRLTLSYDISDSMKVSLGYINYVAKHADDSLFYFRNSDRVFASFRYAF